jgi:hypothetical protein
MSPLAYTFAQPWDPFESQPQEKKTGESRGMVREGEKEREGERVEVARRGLREWTGGHTGRHAPCGAHSGLAFGPACEEQVCSPEQPQRGRRQKKDCWRRSLVICFILFLASPSAAPQRRELGTCRAKIAASTRSGPRSACPAYGVFPRATPASVAYRPANLAETLQPGAHPSTGPCLLRHPRAMQAVIRLAARWSDPSGV